MEARDDACALSATALSVQRPTLAAVARLAGVSAATASRVLNRSAKVSGSALSRVEQAVRELGYVRQRAPGGARGSGAVSVVVFDDMRHYQADSFYARVLLGAEREALRAGRELVVLTALRRSPRDSLLRFLCGGHVDAVVMVGLRADDTPAQLVRAAGVPVTCIGRPPDALDLPYIDAVARCARCAISRSGDVARSRPSPGRAT
jgi:DNA-binding LacI/PurR family transcriptional regulator